MATAAKARRKPSKPKTDQEKQDIAAHGEKTIVRHLNDGSGRRLRVTTDSSVIGQPFFGRFFTVVSPPSAERDWRISELDSNTFDRTTPERLTELLVDLSPDISRAYFDWMRDLNPGWEYDVYVPGVEGQRHEAGYQIVDQFLNKTLPSLYGTVDVPLGRLHTGTFMRGGVFLELVIGKDGRTLVDLATPDPSIVRFKRRDDPVRGLVFEPGVQDATQVENWKSYDLPTIKYIPLDPMPGNPYGRPMVSSALYTALFILGMLHDLRRVISQQGYPRPDIEIDLEMLANDMPSDLEEDSDARTIWVNNIVAAISKAYAALEPDDAFVHTSVVKLNKPVGTMDAESLGGWSAIIEALERMSVRALKTMPFMMAISESTTETQANRQYEKYMGGVRALQHLAETAIKTVLEYGLRANGILADVKFEFAMNRKGEELRDALGEQQQIANEREKLAAGWTEQDEASLAVTDHDAVEAEPRDGAWQTALDIAAASQPAPDEPSAEEQDAAIPENEKDDAEEDAGRTIAVLHRVAEKYSIDGDAFVRAILQETAGPPVRKLPDDGRVPAGSGNGKAD